MLQTKLFEVRVKINTGNGVAMPFEVPLQSWILLQIKHLFKHPFNFYKLIQSMLYHGIPYKMSTVLFPFHFFDEQNNASIT